MGGGPGLERGLDQHLAVAARDQDIAGDAESEAVKFLNPEDIGDRFVALAAREQRGEAFGCGIADMPEEQLGP